MDYIGFKYGSQLAFTSLTLPPATTTALIDKYSPTNRQKRHQVALHPSPSQVPESNDTETRPRESTSKTQALDHYSADDPSDEYTIAMLYPAGERCMV